MSSRRQRERLRELKIARDLRHAEALNAVLSEEKPEPKKSSPAKKKTTTAKKKAPQKPKE